MVGSDSKVADIERFPPFAGARQAAAERALLLCDRARGQAPRPKGWDELQPVDGVVGPELSSRAEVRARTKAPLAIIKVAAGGTHLGGDWNPDQPGGFKLYPLALDWVREALADLEARVKMAPRGFMWHQGENDMFDDGSAATTART
jgi:hypothetical protein